MLFLGMLLIRLLLPNVAAAQAEPLKAARDEYQARVDEYRKTYEKFNLDKTQYAQNPSNINQELLLLSSKQLLAATAQVWYRYFNALGVDAQLTTGKPAEWDEMRLSLDEKQKLLVENLSTYSGLTDKPAVAEAISAARAQTTDFKLIGARAQTLIKFFRFHYAIRQLTDFKNLLAKEIPIQVLVSTDREAQLRGLSETERLFMEIEAEYVTAWNTYLASPPTSGEYMLEQALDDLTPLYDKLVRANRILKEAAKGVEL